jgi:hypothetical protein
MSFGGHDISQYYATRNPFLKCGVDGHIELKVKLKPLIWWFLNMMSTSRNIYNPYLTHAALTIRSSSGVVVNQIFISTVLWLIWLEFVNAPPRLIFIVIHQFGGDSSGPKPYSQMCFALLEYEAMLNDRIAEIINWLQNLRNLVTSYNWRKSRNLRIDCTHSEPKSILSLATTALSSYRKVEVEIKICS